MAGAIFDAEGRVLIQQRLQHQHLGGCWEFPGGKLESGETREEGLARELEEELGITPEVCRPLITVAYDYADKRVLLDVWRVDRFRGEPQSLEGQPFRWIELEQIGDYEFPAANWPIIHALGLPDRLLITPDPGGDGDGFLRRLEQAVKSDVSLVQLRAPSLSAADYLALAREALSLVRAAGGKLMLNGAPALIDRLPADGLHLPGRYLSQIEQRPLPAELLLSCACHDEAELARARSVDADFVLLGAVKPTQTHPGRPPLGWPAFDALVHGFPLPVYALGGMESDDQAIAWQHGGQGIAAIRALWPALVG